MQVPVCAHQDRSLGDSVGTAIAISPVVEQRSSGSVATAMLRTLNRNFDGVRRLHGFTTGIAHAPCCDR
jgi:hypothetical protein